MEAHHSGDHIPGLLQDWEREQHQHGAGAGGFVIPLHMMGARLRAARGCSAASQNTKFGILGILLAGTCTGGQQGACSLVVLLLGTSCAGFLLAWHVRSSGRREQVVEQRWEEETVLFLPLSAGGTLQRCKNNPDHSAKEPKNPNKKKTTTTKKTPPKHRKNLRNFFWKDTISDSRIKTSSAEKTVQGRKIRTFCWDRGGCSPDADHEAPLRGIGWLEYWYCW